MRRGGTGGRRRAGWPRRCLLGRRLWGHGVSIWQTYQPDRLGEFTTTGILGAVQRNADLLEGVETRAQQTTPYLKNLLALSAALQDKYTPQSLGEPVPPGSCSSPTSTAASSTR